MRITKLANVFLLARLAWLVFVAVIAVRGAMYGYGKDGIGGLFLGLVIGILVGAMSATIWYYLFFFILKIGRFIFRPSKHPIGGKV
jgi:hypothetical protein